MAKNLRIALVAPVALPVAPETAGSIEQLVWRLAEELIRRGHEVALFAMAANRLEAPGSKLACATRWLPDVAWLPEANHLTVDQLYRALDFLAVWAADIERDVFLRAADLFRLDVDLIFYDTTTAYFEIDEADEVEQEWAGRLYAPLRRRGHNKEGRDDKPQVIIALAVTRAARRPPVDDPARGYPAAPVRRRAAPAAVHDADVPGWLLQD